MRAALYVRVSTLRQADAELSIPDQIRHGEAFCAARGWTLVETHVEPGASGTDDARPVFQRMMERATAPDRPYDVILVHSLSRFFRDAMLLEWHRRKLARAGVQLVSMTQDFAQDGSGHVVRQMLAVFDEYTSHEIAKHTCRGMIENARQGFWNGSQPPFGYATAEAGQRSARVKKVLVIDEEEAAIVRRIHDLLLGRHGPSLGVKAIANTLNAEGVLMRGRPFHISNVHRILTSETYVGRHHFNRVDSRTRAARPREEWITVSVPPILDEVTLDATRNALAARNPRVTPPRVVNGPTLLTGLAVCASCGAGMTIRTGKSGRYRYYACAGRAQKGPTACEGCALPMDDVDDAVTGALAERVLRPERMADLIAGAVAAREESQAKRRHDIGRLKADLTTTEGALRNLLGLVEQGLMATDDPTLAERLGALKVKRTKLSEESARTTAGAAAVRPTITPAKLERLSAALRDAVRAGPIDRRKLFMRHYIRRIDLSRREIRLSGPTSALLAAANADPSTITSEVPSFVRRWRPVRDSNPCYQRERLVS